MPPLYSSILPSCSLLLGICNGQTWLDRAINEAVEVLAEHTGKFDIGVIDHGSTDDTADVAATLASIYPQVYYCGPAQNEAGDAMLRAARAATGSILVLRPVGSSAPLRELDRLWSQLDSHDLVVGRIAQPRGGMTRWTRRLARSLQAAPSGVSCPLEVCLLPRDVLRQLRLDSLSREQLLSAAADRDLTYAEVDLSPNRRDYQAAAQHGRPPRTPQRRVHPASSRAGIGRPNFLGQLKRLAVGE
ncbi:MAG: glycosyltransferase [Pirellulales bacterium]|nr:glycosyltransferase [Pirellulales bacterium]